MSLEPNYKALCLCTPQTRKDTPLLITIKSLFKRGSEKLFYALMKCKYREILNFNNHVTYRGFKSFKFNYI